MLRPLKSNVLIDPDPQPESDNGILLPQYRDWVATSGTVLDCGDRVNGVQAGDRVVFSPDVGTRVTEGQNEYLLLHDSDVLAVVTPGVVAELQGASV